MISERDALVTRGDIIRKSERSTLGVNRFSPNTSIDRIGSIIPEEFL